MLMSSLIFALASALALFILLVKMNIRRVLGYDVFIDIVCTVVLVGSFHGTVTGMAAAMFAAVVISAALLAVKLVIGYERLHRDPDHRFRLHWVRYYPIWPERVRRWIRQHNLG